MENQNCNNCNRNNNSQGTFYGLIILILVCVIGHLYAQNLHLQKEVDHYKYYFDDGYDASDDDDDIISQILKPFSKVDNDGIRDFSGEVNNVDDAKSRLKISTPWENYSW